MLDVHLGIGSGREVNSVLAGYAVFGLVASAVGNPSASRCFIAKEVSLPVRIHSQNKIIRTHRVILPKSHRMDRIPCKARWLHSSEEQPVVISLSSPEDGESLYPHERPR